jgi:septum formation topological specificity factor MinE
MQIKHLKTNKMKKSILTLVAAFVAVGFMQAQFRENNKDGLNVFETPKTEKEFTGVKTTIGGGFTQGFQTLNHTNIATIKMAGTPAVDNNGLYRIRPGFNLASANLALKTELADGVALNMELYLAARHHNETWVKGGYIQFDKLPFLKMDFVDNIMKYTTIKMGQMDVNFGDSHFRRSDGGNTILNPFVENYIVDAFATEIGAEFDVNYNGFVGVLGLTNGLLKGNINVLDPTYTDKVAPNDTVLSAGKNNPSLILKLGYDKELTDDLRVRLTGSAYFNKGAASSTLFGGDRTGSNYVGVIDYVANSTAQFTSGRYNPGFSDKVTAYAGNLFVKFHGLESFTSLEAGSGRSRTETTGDRNFTQIATDLIYRFGAEENFWVGVRYNTVTAQQYNGSVLPALTQVTPASPTYAGAPAVTTKVDFAAREKGMYDVTINRLAFSAGWFITKNVLAKVEYVTQDYNNFLYNDIRSNAKFKGIVAQAVIGF